MTQVYSYAPYRYIEQIEPTQDVGNNFFFSFEQP